MENTITQTAREQPMVEIHNLNQPPRDIHAVNHIYPSVSGDESCPTCSAAKNAGLVQYIYAVGKIDYRFPSKDIQSELRQAISRNTTIGLTDNEAVYAALLNPQNRYIARELCWVFSIGGLDTFLLKAIDPTDFDLLTASLRSRPLPTDFDVVIGILGGIAPPQYCNGLQIPIVGFKQIYSFDLKALVESLIKSIPKHNKISAKEFAPAAEELFLRMIQMTENEGAKDGDRAVNYVAMRYPAIYTTAAECFARNFSLTGLKVERSSLTGQNVQNLIFEFTNRTTGVTEKHFCSVNVTGIYPSLDRGMQMTFDRPS